MRKNQAGNCAAYSSTTIEVGGAQLSDPEDRQRHQRRLRHARLDVHERAQQCDRGGDRDEHAGGAPAERVGADDAERERDETRGDEHRAGDVEMARPDGADAGRDHPQRDRDHDRAEHDVDREDRRPAESLREEAAEQRARGRAEAADGAPRGEAAVALRTLGEG